MAQKKSIQKISVRRIRPGEGGLYKRVRLAALADSPDSFATTFESATARSPDSWNEQADAASDGSDRFTLFAFVEAEPAGMAALYRDSNGGDSGEVIQVWVDPAHRGGPVANRLIDGLISLAEDHGYERISAQVNLENERGIRFFKRYGFELTDETEPLREDSHLVSGLMTRQI